MAAVNVRRDVRDRLLEVTARPIWVVLATAAAVHLLGVRLPTDVQYGILLATVLLLGLPHGALDHLTLPRARAESLTARRFVVFCGWYLLLASAYGVAWLVAPTASFVGFVLLTWFHWGQGDRAHLALVTDAAHLENPWVNRLTLFVRGGLPMLVPLIWFPDAYESVLATVVGLFGSSGDWIASLFSSEARLALGVGFGLLTLSTLAWGYRVAGDRPAWRIDVVETILLWVFFLSVPPILAIGLYFVVWHSLRHLARLVAIDDTAASALARGSTTGVLTRLTRDALPMTAGALVLFGAIAVLVPTEPGTVADVAGVYLVLLAVLTLPHAVVVTVLDRIQGVSP